MQHMNEPLSYIDDLIEALPEGLTKLRVLDMKRRTARGGALRTWFDQLLSHNAANVDTLRRCRNSLMHGGPSHPEVVGTAARFAHAQASETLMVALQGSMDVKSVAEAHRQHVAGWSARAAKLRSAKASKDALYGDVDE